LVDLFEIRYYLKYIINLQTASLMMPGNLMLTVLYLSYLKLSFAVKFLKITFSKTGGRHCPWRR